MTKTLNSHSSDTDLSSLFAPRSIAVIGATDEMSRAGGRALGVLKMVGYPGAIYPVHPGRADIQGLPAHVSLAAIPGAVDLAIIALGPERVAAAVRECGDKGVRAAAVFADGFTPALRAELTQAVAEAHRKSGLRLLGPNSIGYRSVRDKVYGTFAGDVELGTLPGPTAFIAQSGGMSTYFGSTLLARRGVGTSYLIDTGNEVDIEAADCVEYIANDPEVSAIALMLEGARDGRKLNAAIAHAVARGKTVVAMKMARSNAGLAQAASHTGALAGKGELFDAELRSAGACVVADEMELIDAMVVAAHRRIPAGRGVGVVTSSGGFGILALDAAERAGMQVPAPTLPPTVEQQAQVKGGKFSNPFDFSSSLAAGPRAAETALDWIIAQPDVDAVVMFHFYSAMRADRQESLLKLMGGAAARTKKPVFVCGVAPPEFEQKLRDLGVLWFEDPARLMKALSNVLPAARSAAALPATAGSHAAVASLSGARARQKLAHLSHLPQVRTFTVANLEEARARQRELGGKVFLKVESDAHAHKSEFGLVSAPLDAHELEAAYRRLEAARASCGATGTPIVVQPFERGCGLALGAYIDPIFGPAVMVATGGIFLEILNDVTFAAAPVTLERARDMILGLTGAPLLLGARGRPLADVDAAAAALVDLSLFIAEAKDEFVEVDINPLIVKEQGRGVVAVDALLVPKT